MPLKSTADDNAAVTLKLFCSLLTLAFVLTGSACGADRGHDGPPFSPSPTALGGWPPPPPPPQPGTAADRPPAGELWSLTTTIVSLEGSACFWSHPVGKKLNWTLSVERNGEDVRFVYDVNNPDDNVLLVGAVHEQSFAAASGTYGSFWQCAGGVTFSSSVTGSFSSDGQTLIGRERFIYRLDRGGELMITWEWNAARR
jgi:hypothetical protein